MICNFDDWPHNYLTKPRHAEQVHSIASGLLFSFPNRFAQRPTRSCWRDVYGPYF